MMHGLIYRTLQVFVQDSYGPQPWLDIAALAGLDPPEFEAMLSYDPDLADVLMDGATQVLNIPRDMLLEDVGTYLVSHPNCEGLRRLLRFGGVDFIDFLHSLEDLPDRARLAVPDLFLPDLELQDQGQGSFLLRLTGGFEGFGHVMVGLLRAIADDYGALALLDFTGRSGSTETVQIALVETDYAEGRAFDLGARGQMASGAAS